jgi:ferric iron reductase protein FhuF
MSIKKDRKNMTIVRIGNQQGDLDATFKSFKELREHLIELLAWDNKEDEKDFPLHTFSLKELLELGDYSIELDFSPNAYITRDELFND